MGKSEDKAKVDRRGFLKTLGGGAAGVAAANVAVVGTAVAAESDNEKRKKRYRETDHVKAFYRTNRY